MGQKLSLCSFRCSMSLQHCPFAVVICKDRLLLKKWPSSGKGSPVSSRRSVFRGRSAGAGHSDRDRLSAPNPAFAAVRRIRASFKELFTLVRLKSLGASEDACD